jgi:hypothetical protein
VMSSQAQISSPSSKWFNSLWLEWWEMYMFCKWHSPWEHLEQLMLNLIPGLIAPLHRSSPFALGFDLFFIVFPDVVDNLDVPWNPWNALLLYCKFSWDGWGFCSSDHEVILSHKSQFPDLWLLVDHVKFTSQQNPHTVWLGKQIPCELQWDFIFVSGVHSTLEGSLYFSEGQ